MAGASSLAAGAAARERGVRRPSRSPAVGSQRLKPQLIGAGRIKVVVVGARGVGKTSLVQRMLGQDALSGLTSKPTTLPEVASAGTCGPQPTVGVDFATRSVCLDGATCPVRLHLWDTSGQERFQPLVSTYLSDLEDHDAAVIVYDVASAESFEEAQVHVRRVRRLASGRPQLALIGAKADPEAPAREVSTEEGRALAGDMGAVVFAEVGCPSQRSAGPHGPGGRGNGEVLSKRSAIEEQLVRPLLRKCRDAAPLELPSPVLLPTTHGGVDAVPASSCAAQAASGPMMKCSQPILRCLGLV